MSRQSRYSSSLIEDYENDNIETVFENDNAETVYEIFDVTITGDSKNVKEKYKPITAMSREESELLWKIDIRAQNFPQIMILRFLLGTFEAGFFPGAVFYITKWYKNNEENFRISLFVSAATIAGAFSGLMSFSAFIIDGTLTCAVALFSFFLIPDSIETASWLTRRERKLATERLSHEPSHQCKDYTENHQILEAFKDWKIYMAMLLYFCILAPLYSFSFFISSIVNGLGFNPPIASDRAGVRGPYLVCCLLVSILGYVCLVTQSVSIPVKYLGACIVGIGLFPCVPTSITWLINNLAGETKCAIGDAMMIAAGNIGAGISTQFYKSLDAPDYKLGHSISLALLIVATIIVLIKFNLLSRANDKKLIEKYNRDIDDEEMTMKFGEKHPSFIAHLLVPGTDLSGTPVPGSRISGTPVPGTRISGTPVPGTHISGTPVPGTRTSGISVPGTHISGTHVHRTRIPDTPVPGTVKQVRQPHFIGQLKPTVILYGDIHPKGLEISQIAIRDQDKADCLIIMGTSLRIPGVKCLIKDFAKAIYKRKGYVIIVNTTNVVTKEWNGIIDYQIESTCDEWLNLLA
ncbi:1719_t:CDS:2 [Gigaspora margarita]|uniref:1719_t:CDS:1 n=1 Tax=Gigaspora margarita TaxID=4874 RepID=A0ABN7UDQ6_GIGMA|nr:1719_t:CDS:2 [Gigaspora margarita]